MNIDERIQLIEENTAEVIDIEGLYMRLPIWQWRNKTKW